MSLHPVLLLGGAGAIGRQTIKALRQAYPDTPLLIGGRDLEKTRRAAQESGGAQGVLIDPTAADLGLGERQVSAVVVFYMDHGVASLRYAQQRRVPHISISSGVFEIAPEIAAYIHSPHAAPIVLGYEWMVGATTVSTLKAAEAFSQVDDIRIHALVDEQDTGGPTVASDFEHLNRMLPAALTRRGGQYVWREGDAGTAHFQTADGTSLEARGFSSIDVVGLATATGAANVAFNIATGVSSSRRRGGPMSTEIIIELDGLDRAGRTLQTRHAVICPQGTAPLTGLGVAMLLERLLGLDGQPPTAAGLYFPYQLLNADAFLKRLHDAGGELRTL